MERLTKANFTNEDIIEFFKRCALTLRFRHKVYKKLAEYEEAEEQGLLVRMKSPVSLNSILFRPVYYKNHKYNRIYILKVTEIKQNLKGVFFRVVDTETSIQSRFYQPSDIGTKIFLTESEALQALRKRENENERT